VAILRESSALQAQLFKMGFDLLAARAAVHAAVTDIYSQPGGYEESAHRK